MYYESRQRFCSLGSFETKRLRQEDVFIFVLVLLLAIVGPVGGRCPGAGQLHLLLPHQELWEMGGKVSVDCFVSKTEYINIYVIFQ